jgi:hypothetical protein
MSTSANQCQSTCQPVPTSTGWHVLWHWLALVGMCFVTGWHQVSVCGKTQKNINFAAFKMKEAKMILKGFVT